MNWSCKDIRNYTIRKEQIYLFGPVKVCNFCHICKGHLQILHLLFWLCFWHNLVDSHNLTYNWINFMNYFYFVYLLNPTSTTSLSRLVIVVFLAFLRPSSRFFNVDTSCSSCMPKKIIHILTIKKSQILPFKLPSCQNIVHHSTLNECLIKVRKIQQGTIKIKTSSRPTY